VLKPYQPRELLKLSLGVPHVHVISLQPELEGLIVPSKFYGVAAAGRATIYIGGSDGEIPRILDEEQCGWTFVVGNSAQLASRIAELAVDPAQVRLAGERARLAFEQRFGMTLACARWRSLLSDGELKP
jgi:colanic acid biosynthesis glycosyl transferase WcaI